MVPQAGLFLAGSSLSQAFSDSLSWPLPSLFNAWTCPAQGPTSLSSRLTVPPGRTTFCPLPWGEAMGRQPGSISETLPRASGSQGQH